MNEDSRALFAGSGSSSGSAVRLNVYDLLQQNDWTYWCGVGVFHSGVEVYDTEYAFGGHEYDAPGVFATKPHEAPGQNVAFRESILCGYTDLPREQVHAVVQQLGAQYKGNRYHLLQMNCNHFSSDLCARLTGQPAPSWINRLASIAVSLHCLLPTGWVPPLRPPTAADAAAAAMAEERERRSLLNPLEHPGGSEQPARAAPRLIT
ncbi:hypothetical protein D9Q98_007560 [Chlorella vulgaris]|uniref:PPPDE domain-containing protein n=1 Tax=Chlorella vulgaris TaxID=3077 RepID=A0A9D4TLT0_CHLVU|nr:hypothetical protein D9Q98_007560 [Chlorella vulgaris]